MSWLDVVLAIIWFGATLSGFWKGAVRIVFSIGGIVGGLWLASLIGADLGDRLLPLVSVEVVASILGYLLPVVVCTLLALVSGWGLERTCEALRLGWLNRLAGAALAGLAAAVLLGVLVATSASLSPACAEAAASSAVASFLLRLLSSFSTTS